MLFDVTGELLWSDAPLPSGSLVQWLELWPGRQESWVLFLVNTLASWVTLDNSFNLFLPQSLDLRVEQALLSRFIPERTL